MRIEHYPVNKLKKQILEIVGKHLDLRLYRVFFFGSRVAECNSRRSDIDIGIEGPEEIPARACVEIREGLDNLPTLYRFDLVDFKKVTPEFKKEAYKSIEYVN
jgi:predicted nucleotidyltransferase